MLVKMQLVLVNWLLLSILLINSVLSELKSSETDNEIIPKDIPKEEVLELILELRPPLENATGDWYQEDDSIKDNKPTDDLALDLQPPKLNQPTFWIDYFTNDSYLNKPIGLNNSEEVIFKIPETFINFWNNFNLSSYQNIPFNSSTEVLFKLPIEESVWNGFLSQRNDTLDLELKPPTENLKTPKKYESNEIRETDYCQVCESHTVCQHPKCEVTGNCSLVKQIQLTKQEKIIVLNHHNKLRSKIALGLIEPHPRASNMNQLEWDSELEFIAQCWANQCEFEHDSCRNTRNDLVGQNIVYHGSTSQEYILEENLESMIDDWFLEYKDLPIEFIPSRPFPNPTFTNHYTQLVWAKTDRIGCARVYSFEDPFYNVYLYCNYAPRGNAAFLEVYKYGEPASRCEENGRVPSKQYPGLCV